MIMRRGGTVAIFSGLFQFDASPRFFWVLFIVRQRPEFKINEIFDKEKNNILLFKKRANTKVK